MRVRDQHRIEAARVQRLQKLLCPGQESHVLAHFAFQLGDVERQLAAPEVDAVPVERPLLGDEARLECRASGLQRQLVTLGVALGQHFQPEIVVEAQIEQRAVHVEQDGVDLVPTWQHGTAAV